MLAPSGVRPFERLLMKTLNQILERHDEYHARPGESEVVVRASRIGRDPMPGDHWGPADAARARAYMIATKGHAPEWHELSEPQKSKMKDSKFDAHVARINLGKTVHIEDTINHTPEIITRALHDAGHISTEHHNDLMKNLSKMTDRHEKYQHLADSLKKHADIDTISYTNEVEAPGKKSYITMNPKRVRILNSTKGNINLERGSKNIVRF